MQQPHATPLSLLLICRTCVFVFMSLKGHLSVMMEAGILRMPCWWTSAVWLTPAARPACWAPGRLLSTFKLLPSSSLQQTDRYLLMNAHASVTLACSEARGEHPLLFSGLLLHRFMDKMEGSGQRSRAGSLGFNLFCPCKSYLGLIVWIKATKCKKSKNKMLLNIVLFPDSQMKWIWREWQLE